MRRSRHRASLIALPLVVATGLVAAGGRVTARQAPTATSAPVQVPTPARSTAPVRPSSAGVDLSRLERIAPLVDEAIAAKLLPGAVVVVGRKGHVVYRRAFGNRALVPAVEPMTEDTVFDAASLTKVVATTTSVMLLVEEGRLRLSDRVSTFIPDFAKYGKAAITIRHLLTHMSGLRPDLDWSFPWSGYETAIRMACEEVPVAAPNERFIYSDINFFLLGDIVHRVSGEPLDVFARRRIFERLGMTDTMFKPSEDRRRRAAPTEACTEFDYPCEGPGPGRTMLRGVVHDPTARRMHGVAGHAGLFTTAADLTLFCRMLLEGGTVNGVRLLAPLTVAKMTSPAMPPGERNIRGLGWDIDSSFSANRGELLPIGSFGHTGFTGTSVWMDPSTASFVVFLSNRVHPDGKGDVNVLRAKIATVAASALIDVARPAGVAMTGTDFGAAAAPPPLRAPVLSGIDVLRAQRFASLQGRRVGLMTNHTGVTRDGASTIDVLRAAPGLTLVSLFSPEHGIRGELDQENVDSSRDEATGLTIHSLYGETRRPTDEMLRGLDTLVIDLQDVGARYYTYMTAMAYVIEEAAKRQIEVVVLDRPNPIGGHAIEGPTLEKPFESYVGYFAMPTRPGLTIGELARVFNEEGRLGARLTVVPMQNWTRDHWFDETGLPWVNPSPNLRNLHQAVLYPGVGQIEYGNISVGRGTDAPFEQIGAPWVDGVALAEYLTRRQIPGVRVYPVSFTPASSKFAGERCRGVFLVVTDRDRLRPVRLGVELASALVRVHPGRFDLAANGKLIGQAETMRRIEAGDDPQAIAASWAADEARWRLLRGKYLIYR